MTTWLKAEKEKKKKEKHDIIRLTFEKSSRAAHLRDYTWNVLRLRDFL